MSTHWLGLMDIRTTSVDIRSSNNNDFPWVTSATSVCDGPGAEHGGLLLPLCSFGGLILLRVLYIFLIERPAVRVFLDSWVSLKDYLAVISFYRRNRWMDKI